MGAEGLGVLEAKQSWRMRGEGKQGELRAFSSDWKEESFKAQE